MSEYAVIKTGGKQYRVSKGQSIRVEKIVGEVGSKVNLDNVLLLGGKVSPKGASVTAKIVAHIKDKKTISFKKKRRNGYDKKTGHRQLRTVLLIENLGA